MNMPVESAVVSVNWEIIGQWGFGILFFIAFMFLLRWVLEQQGNILKNAEEERKSWQTVIARITNEIDKHTRNAQDFHRQVSDAHKYQREEHVKIMEQGNKSCTLMTEATTLLKSLNGKSPE